MDLERVIAALAPRDVVGRASLDVADLAYDTRAITPGALFFCVRGANVDGHELAPQALAAGGAPPAFGAPPPPARAPPLGARIRPANGGRSSARRPRRSTSSTPSARCSTPATAAARWRPRRTPPSCAGSTASA